MIHHDREPCKTAEPITMPFGLWTRVGPRNRVLDEGAHWRQLANTTEPSMCGGDAALCQINLTTCSLMSLRPWACVPATQRPGSLSAGNYVTAVYYRVTVVVVVVEVIH